jgi:uncharacterized membrane protein (UPF0127 family)
MIRRCLLLVVLAGALAAPAAADPPCPAPSATANPDPVSIAAPKATLHVRVADTPAVQEYGLMCVRSMPAHTGMIFVFPYGDARQSFWMKNTLIPLDMVFVRENGRVDSVAADVPATTTATPNDEIPTRLGMGAYVIELNAGEAAADGIVAGARLDVSHVPKAKS